MSWLTLDRRYADKQKADPKIEVHHVDDKKGEIINLADIKLKHVDEVEKTATATGNSTLPTTVLKRVSIAVTDTATTNNNTGNNSTLPALKRVSVSTNTTTAAAITGTDSTTGTNAAPPLPERKNSTSNKGKGIFAVLGGSFRKQKKNDTSATTEGDDVGGTDNKDGDNNNTTIVSTEATASDMSPTNNNNTTPTDEEKIITNNDKPIIASQPESTGNDTPTDVAGAAVVIVVENTTTTSEPQPIINNETKPQQEENNIVEPEPLLSTIIVEESNTNNITSENQTTNEQQQQQEENNDIPTPTLLHSPERQNSIGNIPPPPIRKEFSIGDVPPPEEDEYEEPPPPEPEPEPQPKPTKSQQSTTTTTTATTSSTAPRRMFRKEEESEEAKFEKLLDSKNWRKRLPVSNSYVFEALIENPNPFNNRNILLMNATQVSGVVEAIYFRPEIMVSGKPYHPAKGDVIIAGVPRVGQMPVIHILEALKTGIIHERGGQREYDRLKKGSLLVRVPWIEAPYGFMGDRPGVDATGRLLKSYLDPHLLLGFDVDRHHKMDHKIVCVLRDPLDLRVSWYRHVRRVYRKCAQTRELMEAFDLRFKFHDFEIVPVPTGTVHFSWEKSDKSRDYEDYVSDVLSMIEHNPTHVQVVFYEELMTEQGILTVIKRLREFTEWKGGKLSDEEIMEAIRDDMNHPIGGRRIGSSQAGLRMSSLNDTKRIDEQFEEKVRVKHPHIESYLNMFERITGSSFAEITGLEPRENWFVQQKRLVDQGIMGAGGRAIGSLVSRASNLGTSFAVGRSSSGSVTQAAAAAAAAAAKHNKKDSTLSNSSSSSSPTGGNSSNSIKRPSMIKNMLSGGTGTSGKKGTMLPGLKEEKVLNEPLDPDDGSDGEEFGFV
jgi:hypothetical protein